ncbi:Capsule polysaccharide biosynthesis protein, partial [Rhizoctonia solani]
MRPPQLSCIRYKPAPEVLDLLSSVSKETLKRANPLPLLEIASSSENSFVSRAIKWVVFAVLILNVKSLPGAWHVRVLMPLLKHRLNGLINRRGDGYEWWTSVSPVGRSVFPTLDGSDKGALVVLKCHATLDDCDWIGHLSNSSYAKNLDPARMNMLLSWFPAFFNDGGMAALGAAHYQYIKEIPMNRRYEIRLSIGAWEDKWFVFHKKQKIKSTEHSTNASTPLIPPISAPTTPFEAETSTPAELIDRKVQEERDLDTSIVDSGLKPATKNKKTLQTHDDDGALIHCIAVSAICFKHGRITVPPNVVLATSGYSLTETGDKSNWLNAKRLRERGTAAMTDFFRGGWKLEENKFWQAGPKVEEERNRRLAELRKLTEGMNGLRQLKMTSSTLASRRSSVAPLLQSLPTPIARLLRQITSLLTPADSSKSILPFIPRPIKWFILFVFLFNARSWPGVWHMRVFASVIRIRLNGLLYKRGDGRAWWTSVSPVGRSVFPTRDGSDKGALSVLKCWASPDDCDWNGHLSNSCYAKNLDPARMQACIDWFPAFFGDNGWVALGGAHYHYIREIPINAPYEIRMSIGGWEDKWMYFVAKFVTHPKKSKSGSQAKPTRNTHSKPTSVPVITTPSTPLVTETSTPAEFVAENGTSGSFDVSTVDTKLAPGTSPKPVLRTHDDDGALIHCIAVSTYCFKHGRITVPPRVVLAMCGFSLDEAGDKSNWTKANTLRDRHSARISDFLRGGWKSEDNKFWEVGPKVDAERARRVADLRKLTEGMDGLRTY